VNAAPPNNAPVASFTATVTNMDVAVDGTASSDSDGNLVSYAWQWGDGTPNGSGVTASHTYTAGGNFNVRLTVTDNLGGTNTTTRQVTIVAPQSPAFAQDTFNRTVPAGGWGSADTGGAWTASAGGTRLSVTPGNGVLDLPAAGNNTGAYLGSVSQANADVTATFTLSSAPTGLGTDVYVTPRRMANGDDMRVRVRVAPNGSVSLLYSRRVGGAETFGGTATVAGLTWTTGTAFNVRVQVTTSTNGASTVRARIWASTGTEPTTWQLNQTGENNAALQGPGSVGIAAFRGSTSTTATQVRVSSFAARPVA
jgi:PKD repeat protein